MTQFVLFFLSVHNDYKFLNVLLLLSTIEAIPSMLTRMSFQSATISTFFKDRLWKCSIFKVQAFRRYCIILTIQIIFKFYQE